MKINLETIGTTQINATTVIISDPCYELGIWCQGEVKDVLAGEYEVLYYKGKDTEYITENRAFGIVHKDYSKKFSKFKWKSISSQLGMDAGMSSIADIETYKRWKELDEKEDWWDNIIFGENGMANNEIRIFEDGGVICNSGYGDGCYSAKVARNKEGQIIAIMVEF